MPYFYSDPERESDPHALPNVEVLEAYALICDDCGHLKVYPDSKGTGYADCPNCGEIGITSDYYFYAFGSPGCLWDGEPMGPYDTEDAALEAARENA